MKYIEPWLWEKLKEVIDPGANLNNVEWFSGFSSQPVRLHLYWLRTLKEL